MIELLRAAARQQPDASGVVSASGTVAYRELVRRAESAAAALAARGVSRVAVLDSDAAVVWPLLAAGSLSGVEVCAYPVAAAQDTIVRLRERLGHDVIVTSRSLDGAVEPDVLFGHDERITGEPVTPRRLLVLTTGTSGDPKAACHEWDRVLRVTRRIVPTPDQRWLLAYGLNQFGGLQILLHVAAARATLVAPESFQPRDALVAMREHRVTHASGSPTFWRFLLAEMRSDGERVPDLHQITLSGEAVPPALLTKLKSTFPQAHFSQIYAATEIGQGITVRDGEPGMPISVLEADGDLRFKIVDGELWVSSATAMLGYVDESADKTRDVQPEWRATGDLVEVVGDRILFRGRVTEVVNVGGVKVHPLTVEDRVSGIDGVAIAHAYGKPNAMVGSIVALDVVTDPGADEASLRDAIRAACADLPPAARPRLIKFVDTLATRGAKLSRGAAQ